jgi:hypothetical protein
VSKKPRNVFKLHATKQRADSKCVTSRCGQQSVIPAPSEVLRHAFRDRRPGNAIGLDLRHKRSAQCVGSLGVRELGALSRDDISVGRATMNPDWSIAFHPKRRILRGTRLL